MGFLHYILNEDENSMLHKFFQCQLKYGTRKDWVTSVIGDLKYLNMENLSMEMIRSMKRTSFMNKIKEKINLKAFENLQKVKESHSKVKEIQHNLIKIQKYLQPNSIKITREEAQLIFQLRCRVTETKVNLRGKYDNLECEACGLEEETQQHIIECKELNRNKEEQKFKYENLLNGTVLEKVKIATRFKENFEMLERRKKRT